MDCRTKHIWNIILIIITTSVAQEFYLLSCYMAATSRCPYSPGHLSALLPQEVQVPRTTSPADATFTCSSTRLGLYGVPSKESETRCGDHSKVAVRVDI